MSAGTWNAIGTCVYAAATVTLAVASIFGLKLWRRQLTGTAEYDLARRVLRHVYAVRDEIARVRNPMMLGSECVDRPEFDPSAATFAAEDVTFAYDRRWKRLQDEILSLQVEMTEAEVLWGDVLQGPWRSLSGSVMTLQTNLIDHLATSNARKRGQRMPEREKSVEAVVFSRSTAEKDDDFAAAVGVSTRQFEEALKPHLLA